MPCQSLHSVQEYVKKCKMVEQSLAECLASRIPTGINFLSSANSISYMHMTNIQSCSHPPRKAGKVFLPVKFVYVLK